MVLLRRLQPAPESSAPETDEMGEFNEALREERTSRSAAASVPQEQRRYRNCDEILNEYGHNAPLDRLLIPHVEVPGTIREMKQRGHTNDSIARELGISEIDKVRRLAVHLGCADADDLPPEAA